MLNVIRACHPLLFALVLKRTLRNGPHRLSDAVFNTPAIFFAAA
ncbi:MAG: hypothetical protein RMK97_09435 [Sutterellaceae bacterium]|nr:hypothetical protein [Burkholderiaceae bacterium]MCX7901616.1 hypothetical protein [Burkholderiaceae bacterium]MDW8430704.1 hypothetical protein [Sutterellaceae bacterium]